LLFVECKEKIQCLTVKDDILKTKDLYEVLNLKESRNKSIVLILSYDEKKLIKLAANLKIKTCLIEKLHYSNILNSNMIIITDSALKRVIT